MPPLLLSLPQLDLSWNELGSEGAKALAESLKVNASLTQVLAFLLTTTPLLPLLNLIPKYVLFV